METHKKDSTNQYARWAKTRQIGRTKFVLVFGVLGFGLSSGVLFALFCSVIDSEETFLGALPFSVIACLVGGAIWGMIFWKEMEKRYIAERKSSSITKI